jgi:hypothetical protein
VRVLDLDYVGAQVAEHHRGVRPCQRAGQVDNQQAVQGPGGFGGVWLRRCHDDPPA